MSDVIWAAAIAGAVGIAGNAAQYLGARQQADVELAKVQAENERLRQQVRESERSNRQDTYNRLLAVLDRLDMFATGYHPEDQATYTSAVEELNNLIGGVHLFGAEEVRDALWPLAEELERLGEGIDRRQRDEPHEPYGVAFGGLPRAPSRDHPRHGQAHGEDAGGRDPRDPGLDPQLMV
jgi:hypothetical protein